MKRFNVFLLSVVITMFGMFGQSFAQTYTGDGTEGNPYTVEDVIALSNTSKGPHWVIGYIIGRRDNSNIVNKGNSNIVLSATTDVVATYNKAKHTTVHMKTGPKESLNVENNPDNIGKKVKIFGELVPYFGDPGVKEVSAFTWVEAAPTTPTVTAKQDSIKISVPQGSIGNSDVLFNAAINLTADLSVSIVGTDAVPVSFTTTTTTVTMATAGLDFTIAVVLPTTIDVGSYTDTLKVSHLGVVLSKVILKATVAAANAPLVEILTPAANAILTTEDVPISFKVSNVTLGDAGATHSLKYELGEGAVSIITADDIANIKDTLTSLTNGNYVLSAWLYDNNASTDLTPKVERAFEVALPTIASPTFTPDAGTYFSAINVKITGGTEGAAYYYTTNLSMPTVESTLYTATGIDIATTATLKVLAVKKNFEYQFFTKVYTIDALTPATLPFTLTGGKADAIAANGMVYSGLRTKDYAPPTQLGFEDAGDWLIINVASAIHKIAFNAKINGSGYTGGFIVEVSDDGITYTTGYTVASLTGSVADFTFGSINENVRFVRFMYSFKGGGNVGLGNIRITAPAVGATLTVTDTLKIAAVQNFAALDSILVKGENLTVDLAATLIPADGSAFTLPVASIPFADLNAEAGVQFDVQFDANAVAGVYTAKLVLNSTDVTDTIVLIANVAAVTEVTDLSALKTTGVSGNYYKITGEVTLTAQTTNRNQKWIQDAGTGILIDDNDNNLAGEMAIINSNYQNVIGQYNIVSWNKVKQLIPITLGTKVSDGNTITPIDVTISALNANVGEYDGRLVKINAVQFVDTAGVFVQNKDNKIFAGADTLNFRKFIYDADYIGQKRPIGFQDITAIVNSYNGAAQIAARSTGDMAATTNCPKPTALITADITPTSANISWTGITSTYELTVETNTAAAEATAVWTAFSTITGTVVNAATYSLTGLTADVQYRWFVKAVCSAEAKSPNSDTATFEAVALAELADPTITPPAGRYVTDQTITIADGTAGAVYHYTLDGLTPTTTSTLYSAPFVISDEGNTTLKVLATKVDYADKYIERVYTIEYLPNLTPAPLPFAFDGKRAEITADKGMIHDGLGSDYSSSPHLKFDHSGDELLIQVANAIKEIEFDAKWNPGGTKDFTGNIFKVFVSTNGATYTQALELLEPKGGTETQKISPIAEDIRFIKFVYETKVDGNIALGNIKISKALTGSDPMIALSSATINIAALQHTASTAFLNIRGINLTNDLTLTVDPAAGFTLTPSTLAFADVNTAGEAGVNVEIKILSAATDNIIAKLHVQGGTIKDSVALNVSVSAVTEVATIAAVKAGIVGTTYRITGEVIVTATSTNGATVQTWIEDATGGIIIYDDSKALSSEYIEVGFGYTGLIAELDKSSIKKRLIPIALGTKSYVAKPIIPAVVTITELKTSPNTYLARLVKVNAVMFDTDSINFAAWKYYDLVSGADELTFRTFISDANYMTTAIPTTIQDIVGIVDVNSSSVPQIAARSIGDMAATTNCPKPTALITADITPTSANISWTGIISTYELTVETNTAAAEATAVWTAFSTITGTVVNAATYSLTGLTANAEYRWFVKAVCSGTAKSPNSDTVMFTAVALDELADPTITPAAGNYVADQTITIAGGTEGAAYNYTLDGLTPTTGSTLYTGPFVIGEGTTTLKVLATKAGFADKYITVGDYIIEHLPQLTPAPLPFIFTGGKADITAANGMIQSGITGNDYGAPTQLRFDHSGDELLIQVADAIAEIKFDIRFNGSGTFGGTYIMEVSADGSTFTEVYDLTGITGNTTRSDVTVTPIAENIRFIRFTYVKKTTGNIGLGNIRISKALSGSEPMITLSSTTLNIDAFHGVESTVSLNVKGINLTEDLNLTVDPAAGFTITPATLTAAAVMAADGANVEIKVLPATAANMAAKLYVQSTQVKDSVALNVSVSTFTEVTTIAAIKTGTVGTIYRITGEVILTAKTSSNNQKWIEDATAGILIYDRENALAGADAVVGYGYTGLIAELGESSDIKRLIPIALGTKSASATPIIPAVVTIAELKANPNNYLARLVRVNAVMFDTDSTKFAGWKNYDLVSGADILNFSTYTIPDADYIGTTIPTTVKDIVGIVDVRTNVPQIAARSTADIMDTENCPKPTGLITGAITPTSATLTWEGLTSSYELTVETNTAAAGATAVWTAFNDITGTTVNAATYSLTGLTEGSEYRWFAKAVCSETAKSPNSDTVPFTAEALLVLVDPTITPAAGNYAEDQTITIAGGTEGAVYHYTLSGVIPTKDSTLYTVPFVIGEGTTTLEVLATKAGYGDKYITVGDYIIEHLAVLTPAPLPFTFDGKKADVTADKGMIQTGLGDDYSESPHLGFRTTGSELLIQVADAIDAIEFDIKYNGNAANPTFGGEYIMEISVDGTNYTEEYSLLAVAQGTVFEEIRIPIADDVRFVRFKYVNKTVGNVALGNINISKALVGDDPAISVDETLAMEALQGIETSDFLNIKGINLTQDLTATIIPANSGFSLETTTISKDALLGTSGVDLEVLFTNNTAGAHAAKLVFSSTEIKDTVDLTATVIALNEVADLAALRSTGVDGEFYKITGQVVLTAKSSYRNEKWIQDATAGILIYDEDNNLEEETAIVNAGYTGVIAEYVVTWNGIKQLIPITLGTKTSENNTVVPIVVTVSELKADVDKYEARLVRVNGAKFITTGEFEANKDNLMLVGADTLNFRTFIRDADYIGTEKPTEVKDIIALVGSHEGAVQIAARSNADILDAGTVVECDIPTNLQTANITNTTARLTWAGEVEKYMLMLEVNEDGTWTEVSLDNAEVTAKEFALTALIAETEYRWTVKAICSANNISDYATKVVFTTTGGTSIDELNTIEVSIYPNPSNGEFILDLGVDAKVEIFNLLGVMLETAYYKAGKSTVNIENSGIYFVKITSVENGIIKVNRVIVR